jgi:hypothetical protein
VPPSRARNYYAHVQVYGHDDDDDDSHSGYVRTSIPSIRLSATLYQAAWVGSRLHYSSKGVQMVYKGQTISLSYTPGILLSSH